MTWLPRSPDSTLVLWLTHETVLDPTGHWVPRTKPICLLHTWRPHRQRPFALVLHLHQHESSHKLHLQYLAKNQSAQLCQSLITPGSDHPPVLEPHMILTDPPRPSTFLESDFNMVMHDQCQFHHDDKYTMTECKQLKHALGVPSKS
jgi:hypothetical protein